MSSRRWDSAWVEASWAHFTPPTSVLRHHSVCKKLEDCPRSRESRNLGPSTHLETEEPNKQMWPGCMGASGVDWKTQTVEGRTTEGVRLGNRCQGQGQVGAKGDPHGRGRETQHPKRSRDIPHPRIQRRAACCALAGLGVQGLGCRWPCRVAAGDQVSRVRATPGHLQSSYPHPPLDTEPVAEGAQAWVGNRVSPETC